MKKYTFPEKLKTLDGTPFFEMVGTEKKDVNFHHWLANSLYTNSDPNSGVDAAKAIDWAQQVYKSGSIQLDETDRERLKGFIQNNPFPAFAKVEMLAALK